MLVLAELGAALEAADAKAVGATLADDVTLRVAVLDAPFFGRPAATQILSMVLDGALHHIRVGETIPGDASSVLMFTAQVAGYSGRGDGLLVVRGDRGGPISELIVFIRPLPALQALSDDMGRRLARPRPEGTA